MGRIQLGRVTTKRDSTASTQAGRLSHERDSTTPFEHRAKFYALAGEHRVEGIVYKINTALLDHFSIVAHRVADSIPEPSVPEDDEFILVTVGGRPIPAELVTEVLHVFLT